MKEILFRGKRVDNGEWIHGGIDLQYGEATIFNHDCVTHSACDVDVETVGQYTGLKDKNGIKIFEGDVIKGFKSNFLYKICYGEYLPPPLEEYCENRELKLHTAYGLYAKNEYGEYMLEDNKSMEVVGNIFENPKMMEGN